MREFDLIKALGFVFVGNESSGIRNVAEEEKSSDRGDEERKGDDLVEVVGEPCGEIEVFGLREAIWAQRMKRSDVGFRGFRSGTILDQH